MEKESCQTAGMIEAALEEIGESFAGLRLTDPRSNEMMAESVRKNRGEYNLT